MDFSAEEWTRAGATLSDKTWLRLLRKLRTQLAALEERRPVLLTELGEQDLRKPGMSTSASPVNSMSHPVVVASSP
jgi:hypothetical protein